MLGVIPVVTVEDAVRAYQSTNDDSTANTANSNQAGPALNAGGASQVKHMKLPDPHVHVGRLSALHVTVSLPYPTAP